MKRFIIVALGLFLTILLILAVVGTFITDKSLNECFFIACCGVLYVTGMVLGFTYKEICVIVNIYLESGLCLLSALWVTWTAIKRFYHKKTVGNGILMVSGFIYGLVYLGGFIWLCQHYAMPLNNAFDLCYHELVQLSKDYHTTYYNVNYAVFIILFLITTIGNILLGKLIQKGHQQE